MMMLGNEAIARGAIEAGVAFATAYPGTPSSEIAMNFFAISKQTDLYFEFSANEKVALEMAAGAAVSGLRCMVTMKHVGVNVAADPLMTLAYTGVNGALVLVSADDPAMFSSQNEQDNRWYGKLSGLPVLEPSSVQEAKEMVKYAFDLSERLGQPVIFRTTTRLNHASGVVTLGEMRPRVTEADFKKDPFSYVCVPAVSRKLHVRLLEKYEEALAISNECQWNMLEGSGPYGIVCNGVSYGYVKDSLEQIGAKDRFRVLRVGFSHPLPSRLIKEFLDGCEKVLVVEEGEPYLEEGVKAIAQEAAITIPIRGKGEGLLSRLYEFDPAMVRRVIGNYFGVSVSESVPIDTGDLPEVPPRPPNLCAGCPHRATYVAIKEAIGDEAIYPTDIGCYTLGLLPPLHMGDFLICMGSSIGTAGGFAKATGKKVIAFAGDSTFFHACLHGLASAVFNNHDITLVVLDNGTTAMTGNQPHPGVEPSHFGIPDNTHISIEEAVRGLGVKKVITVNPYKLKQTMKAIREAVEYRGVSVVVSRQICPLFARGVPELVERSRSRAFYVDERRCRNHRVCVEKVACPAFYIEGAQVRINQGMCTGCTICAQVCPENAILPVKEM
jgi:indolepyruvate ferredoxin oxidoreductase alpha subunit